MCNRSYSRAPRLLTTGNEVLLFLVAESGVWMPKQVHLARNSRYSSLFFVSAIARLKQLSQVLAHATVSTFVQIDCIALFVLKIAPVCVVLTS